MGGFSIVMLVLRGCKFRDTMSVGFSGTPHNRTPWTHTIAIFRWPPIISTPWAPYYSHTTPIFESLIDIRTVLLMVQKSGLHQLSLASWNPIVFYRVLAASNRWLGSLGGPMSSLAPRSPPSMPWPKCRWSTIASAPQAESPKPQTPKRRSSKEIHWDWEIPKNEDNPLKMIFAGKNASFRNFWYFCQMLDMCWCCPLPVTIKRGKNYTCSMFFCKKNHTNLQWSICIIGVPSILTLR